MSGCSRRSRATTAAVCRGSRQRNSFATKARAAVRSLRAAGKRIGLVRLRQVRPWPGAAVAEALAGRRVAVIDQNLAPGLGGILYQEVAAAVAQRPDRPTVLRSFVGEVGGKDIGPGEFRHVLETLEQARPDESPEGPELLYTEADWQQAQRALQRAVAPPPAKGAGS